MHESSRPSPLPRDISMIEVEDASEWILDASDPYERGVMEIVRMHRSVLDSHERRFEAAIEHLKGIR